MQPKNSEDMQAACLLGGEVALLSRPRNACLLRGKRLRLLRRTAAQMMTLERELHAARLPGALTTTYSDGTYMSDTALMCAAT